MQEVKNYFQTLIFHGDSNLRDVQLCLASGIVH